MGWREPELHFILYIISYIILIVILQNTTPQALYFHFSSCINKGYVMIVCMYRKSTIRFYFVSRHACGGGKAKINVGKKVSEACIGVCNECCGRTGSSQ